MDLFMNIRDPEGQQQIWQYINIIIPKFTDVSKPKADTLYCKPNSRGVKSLYLMDLRDGSKYDVTQTDGERAQDLTPDPRLDFVQQEATQRGGRDVSQTRAQ